jgi:hypothetical protein
MPPGCSSANAAAIGGRRAAWSTTEIIHEHKGSTKPVCIPITAIKERRNMNIRKSALALIFIPLALALATLGTGVAHATTGEPEGSSTDIPPSSMASSSPLIC